MGCFPKVILGSVSEGTFVVFPSKILIFTLTSWALHQRWLLANSISPWSTIGASPNSTIPRQTRTNDKRQTETWYLQKFQWIQKIGVFWEGQGKEKHTITTIHHITFTLSLFRMRLSIFFLFPVQKLSCQNRMTAKTDKTVNRFRVGGVETNYESRVAICQIKFYPKKNT